MSFVYRPGLGLIVSEVCWIGFAIWAAPLATHSSVGDPCALGNRTSRISCAGPIPDINEQIDTRARIPTSTSSSHRGVSFMRLFYRTASRLLDTLAACRTTCIDQVLLHTGLPSMIRYARRIASRYCLILDPHTLRSIAARDRWTILVEFGHKPRFR